MSTSYYQFSSLSELLSFTLKGKHFYFEIESNIILRIANSVILAV